MSQICHNWSHLFYRMDKKYTISWYIYKIKMPYNKLTTRWQKDDKKLTIQITFSLKVLCHSGHDLNKMGISHIYCRLGRYTDLNGKSMWLQSHTPTHTILEIHVWYVALLKHCIKSFPNCSNSFVFYTLYYTSYYFPCQIVCPTFSCSCYLSILRHS